MQPLLLALVLFGCGEKAWVNTGLACITEDEPSDDRFVPLRTDELFPLTYSVSGGCGTRNLHVSCEVELDGSDILVTGTSTARQRHPLLCEYDFVMVTATCDVPALSAGDYRLVLGSVATDAVGVPGRAKGCLSSNENTVEVAGAAVQDTGDTGL